MKPFHMHQTCRTIPLALLGLLIVTLMLYIYGIEEKPTSSIPHPKLNSEDLPLPTQTQFTPTVEFVNGTELIWQMPNSPKAALFIAHGCHGRAAHFWDEAPSCPNCVGLPEERAIVRHALDQEFAVLAISSSGRCWSFGKEIQAVKQMIRWWAEKNELNELPVVGLGASSGGYFLSALAAEMHFSSIALMIAEGVFGSMGIPEGYPPTLFVHMPKDLRRTKLIQMNMELLRQKGVRVKEVRCLEFPLSPYLLSDRIPGLDHEVSAKLYELFRDKGFIDEKGYMRNDGRGTRWKHALKESKLTLEKRQWHEHIQEELNLAYGYHEMTSLHAADVFDWFEFHLNS